MRRGHPIDEEQGFELVSERRPRILARCWDCGRDFAAAFRAARRSDTPSVTESAMVRWLYERARVGDLVYKFASFLDTRQWQNYIDLFADDGAIELPWGNVTRQMLQKAGGPRMLMSLHATHHVSSNHQIDVAGATARSRSYVLATHVLHREDPKHWVVGGWYENEYRLIADDWRIVKSRLNIVWESGDRPR